MTTLTKRKVKKGSLIGLLVFIVFFVSLFSALGLFIYEAQMERMEQQIAAVQTFSNLFMIITRIWGWVFIIIALKKIGNPFNKFWWYIFIFFLPGLALIIALTRVNKHNKELKEIINQE